MTQAQINLMIEAHKAMLGGFFHFQPNTISDEAAKAITSPLTVGTPCPHDRTHGCVVCAWDEEES